MVRAPHSGSHRRRRARRLGARSCVALLCALTAVLAGQSPAIASGSTTPVHAETDSGASPAYVAEFLVAPETPVLTSAVDEVEFTVLIRNVGETTIPSGSLDLTLSAAPVTSTGALDATAPPMRQRMLASVPVGSTSAGAEREVAVTVSTSAGTLGRTAAGVYTVRAALRLTPVEPLETGSTPLLVSPDTPFVWQGLREVAPVPLTQVVPLMLPTKIELMPTPTQLRETATRLLAVLDAAERAQATLAVDPRLPAIIQIMGERAPQQARELLARLRISPLPIFLLQYADADPAAQAALGFTELLQPLGFAYVPESQRSENDSADGGSATAASPDGDASDGSSADGAPSDLGHLPAAVPGAWPAEGAVNAATLNLLTASGIDSLVLASTNVTEATGTRAAVEGFTALIADSALTDESARAFARSQTERAVGLSTISARLAIAAISGSSGVVLAVDRESFADAADPARLITSVLDLPWVMPTAAAAQPAGTATLVPGALGEQHLDLLKRAQLRSTAIEALAPLVVDPAALLDYQRARQLHLLATRTAGANIIAGVDEAVTEADEQLLRGVSVVASENTQLVGTTSRVPVTIHNHLPFEAIVTLRAAPTSAGISVPQREFTELKVHAGGNLTTLVTVSSRVSSGESGLALSIQDRAGKTTFSERSIPLSIRSSFEAILLGALGVAAAVLLGFGILRSLRRRRVARTALSGTTPDFVADNAASGMPKA